MLENKKGILLYIDQLAVLNKMTDEQAGRLFKTIYFYSIGDEEQLNESTSDPIIGLLFETFKGSLERNEKLYQKKCEKRREAGRLGGLQRVANLKQSQADASDVTNEQASQATASDATHEQANEANASIAKQDQANASKLKHNQANQADKDKERDKDKDKERDIIIKSSIDIDDMSTSKEADDASAIDYKEIVDFWNATTKGTMGTLRSIDHNRRKMVRARIKEHGIGAFREMIENAARSDFMHGAPWASFDWCIKPNNFTKVLEGNYEGRKSGDRIDVSHIRNTNEKSWTL